MRVTLHDGSRVVIRPIEVGDGAALAAGHERLSGRTQYQRYLSSKPHLSRRELDYLTDIDHRDHEALVAIDPRAGDSFVGVARYVRTAPEAAEPAIVIADDWQGRGLGGRLLDALVQRAREEGIRRFEASVLAGNRNAIRVLGRLGETTERQLGDEVQLEIEFSSAPAAGVRVRALLDRFSTDTPGAARTLLELLSPRHGATRRAQLRNRIVVAADVLADVTEKQAARLVVLSGHDRANATAVAACVASRSACDVLIVHTV